jgi:hypothetical protein
MVIASASGTEDPRSSPAVVPPYLIIRNKLPCNDVVENVYP